MIHKLSTNRSQFWKQGSLVNQLYSSISIWIAWTTPTQTFSLYFRHEKKKNNKFIHILADLIPEGFINIAWDCIRFKAQSIRKFHTREIYRDDNKKGEKCKCNIFQLMLLFCSLFFVHCSWFMYTMYIDTTWHQRILSAGLHINE